MVTTLVLPYPVSANRYWRSVTLPVAGTSTETPMKVGPRSNGLELVAWFAKAFPKIAEQRMCELIEGGSVSINGKHATFESIVYTDDIVKVQQRAKFRQMIVPTKEAKDYKAQVEAIAWHAGIRKPLQGRVRIAYELYPDRPQDWQKRAAKDPLHWDETVRCIDLDNAQKVLMDSLKGVVMEDDRWVFEIQAKRCEPDGKARLVVRIEQLVQTSPQPTLFGEAA